MANEESIDDVLNRVLAIGEDSEEKEPEAESIMDQLGATTEDVFDDIGSAEELINVLNASSIQDSPEPKEDETVSVAGAFARGVRDAVANNINYLLDRGSTDNLITAGTRAKQLAGEDWGNWKQGAYSIGHEAAHLVQNILVGTKTGGAGAGTGAAVTGPAAPAGAVAGGIAGFGAGYTLSAGYNALVEGAEVFKDSYNDALNRGMGESDAKWEAYEKAGATMGLEYLSQFIPIGKAGAVASKLVPDLVKKGIIKVEGKVVKVLNKDAFKKVAAGATPKEAVTKQVAKKAALKQAGKDIAESTVEESGEEGAEELTHQIIEILNDPNKTMEDLDWEAVKESAKMGGVAGGILRAGAPHIQKGVVKAKQLPGEAVDRYKYGKKVSEDITNIDDKKITVNAREKTIEEAKKTSAYETAADKQSVIQTNLENTITDSEGNIVKIENIKEDEQYTFKDKNGLEQTMSGEKVKQVWKEEYTKNKDIHKKQIVARDSALGAFNELYSVKDKNGKVVTDISPDEEYKVTFAGETQTVLGKDVDKLKKEYLQRTVNLAREELGIGNLNSEGPTKVSSRMKTVLDAIRKRTNDIREFYSTHQVIDLETNQAVNPNEVKPEGRYKVLRNDGTVVNEDTSGLGVSILEKYSPVKHPGWSPINLSESEADLIQRGDAKVNGKYLNLSRKANGDLIDQYTLHEQVGTSGYLGVDWDSVSNDGNKLFTIKNRNGDVVVKDYTADQINTFLDLVTRNASMEDADFISEHTIQTMEGNEVDWNSLDENDTNARYKILHNGNVIGENLSSRGATLYKRLAARQFIKTDNGQTYIYIKASSQYEDAPGTLFVRANDPTNTTYIGDNTDLMGDTQFDYERDIISEKQKQQTRLAILKAIKAQQDAQTKAENAELNADEAGNEGTSPKAFMAKKNDAVLERQSEFSGGANPESFEQTIEYEWADDFIFSKPDTVPSTREEIAYTLQSDVDALSKLYDGDINNLVKGNLDVTIGKEHLRSILSKLAKNLGYKMLNELGEKGIQGKHAPENAFGMIATKLKYFRIRNSRDYNAGLHELGHGIFRDGLFGSGEKQLHTNTDSSIFIDEMEELFSKEVAAQSDLDVEAYKSKEDFSEYMLAEEYFCEALKVLSTNPKFEQIFRQYAPKTYAALDNYLTETNSWSLIKQMQIASKFYVTQSPLQRAIADLTMPNKDMYKQVFSPTWWKNICYKKLAADLMSYTTDDMAGIRYMAKQLGIKEGSDELEYLRSIPNDMSRRFVSGDGCNFSGQSLKGYGFKNLKEFLKPIYDKFGEAGLNKLQAALWAQATIGENIGNERVLTKLQSIANKQQHKFTQSFRLMRRFSNNFWEEFIKKEDTQAGDVTDISEFGLSAEDVAKLINEYKNTARQLLNKGDIARAAEVPELREEFEQIQKEQDEAIKKARMEVLNETIMKEALKQNFKHTLLKDISDTGQDIVDALTIYDDVFVNDDNAAIYSQAAQDFHDYQDALLYSIAGASPEMKFYAQRIKENGAAWHAPLLRQFAEDEDMASPKYLLVNKEGSDRSVTNLYENTIKQTVALFTAASRSATKNFLVNLAQTTGSGLYIREIAEPSTQVKVTLENLNKSATEAVDEKLQELRDRGVDVSNSTIKTTINNVLSTLKDMHMISFDLFAPTLKVDKEHCQFSYYDPSEHRMRFFETEKGVYNALEKPTGSSSAVWRAVGGIARLGMIAMKLNLITINPAFLLLTNPVRDTFTLSWKGDTPLIRTGNRFLDSNPLNTVPGAIYYVAQTYLDYILHRGDPDIFKIMDQFGVGYNTRNNTYRNLQKLVQNDPSIRKISSNPLKAVLQIGESVFDKLGTLDKLARVAQLKAMLKRDGLSVDNFNVNRRNVAAMVLEKQVLLNNGITPEIINKYLTDEQRTIWENTAPDEDPVLDLSADQIKAINKELKDSDIHEFTEAQRVKYAKALRMCTTDFARGGELLRGVNKVFMFAQPAFNGTAQSMQILKDRIATGHGDEVLANILTAFVAGLTYQYLLPDDEDESEDEMWKGIKFKVGDTTWRAPVLAEDMVWFQMARYLMKDSPKDYQRFFTSFFNNINPFGTASGPLSLARSIYTGKRLNDWSDSRYGQSIVPDYMTKTMGTNHPEMFYNESTSALARLAGKYVSNPMKIQYFMDQTGLSIWDNIVENLMGVRRVTKTQAGIDIQNNSRRWSDLMNMVGIDRHPYQTRSQLALENMLNDAKGEYYYKVPSPAKRKRPVGLTAEQRRARNNYLALNQINQTIGIFNKLESIAQDKNDRDTIRKQKTAYMQKMVRTLEKVPGMEGKYYYQLSNLRKQKQRQLDWKERVLSSEARKQVDKEGTEVLSKVWQHLIGANVSEADELRPGERPTQIESTEATYPVTAQHESGGSMASTKPASRKVKGHEVGGFGMYQLDPFAPGGHEKMRNYIRTSAFHKELAEAVDLTYKEGIDYKKLSTIWEKLATNPSTAGAFTRDYENFMVKEYLPQSLLNIYKEAGYDIDNPNVKDAIFSYSIQRPASAKAFAKSLPKATYVDPIQSIHDIMESKRNNPHLKRYSNRYDDEEKILIAKERSRK